LTAAIIQAISHKGLRLFFEKGNGSKLPAEYLAKIALILDALDAVASEDDIKALGVGIHRLGGNYAGFWSIKVSPNYRIIFRYSKGDIFDVDYIDYH
jgi:proteic killer suppression protein